MNKKIINKIAWWIPIKKWRDNFRNKYNFNPIHTIPNVVLITNKKCNLKCKNCHGFSAHLSDKLGFYKAKDIINDIKFLTKQCKIYHLQLQGGEFFLHPECYNIIKYVSSNDRIERITIATNGIIIPKDDILLLIKKDNRMTVRISDYGKINANTREKLKNKLIDLGINNFIYDTFIGGEHKWADMGNIYMKKLTYDEMLNSYNNCLSAKWCMALEDGFISTCSKGTINHIIFNYKRSEKDGISIRENINFDKILDFIKKLPPIEACYYCYGDNCGRDIPPAIQMTKEELEKEIKYIENRP